MKKLLFLLIIFTSVNLIGQTKIPTHLENKSSFDFSNLSWIDAYDSMHATLALRYPYTTWKAIDWEVKNSTTRSHILQAQEANDSLAFTTYLLAYLYAIPDGHIMVAGDRSKFQTRYIKGSYGFNMLPLDDETIVVSKISDECQAYEAGLRTGDRILTWNGVNIDSIENLELLNYPKNYSTIEGRKFSRYLMLSRDSVGSTSIISFQKNNIKEESTVTLTATNDNLELYLQGLYNTGKPIKIDSVVQYKIIDNNIGYLYIGAEVADGETPEEIIQHPDFIKVKEAVTFFNEQGVDKLIVDLRFNMGGNDLQAAVTMGLFYDQPAFYEYITASYDEDYEINYELWTQPLTPRFNGKIAVIVDPNCISTGEGFAMMFQRLDEAHVVSHWGTNGAFGMVNYDPILMPGDLQITFPQGRSLNKNKIIQIDSDSNFEGGITPDIRVPLTVENIKKQWQQGIDVQLEYAISNLLEINYTNLPTNYILYPNPCKNNIYLKFSSSPKSDQTFNLYNISGQLVFHQILKSGSFQHTIELSQLFPGLYLYTLEAEGKAYKGKITLY